MASLYPEKEKIGEWWVFTGEWLTKHLHLESIA